MKIETASPRPWRLRFNAPCLIEPNEDDTRRAKIARTDCSHGIGAPDSPYREICEAFDIAQTALALAKEGKIEKGKQ